MEYIKKTRVELICLCKDQGIKGYSSLNVGSLSNICTVCVLGSAFSITTLYITCSPFVLFRLNSFVLKL